MKILVGYLKSPEGQAALAAAIEEARLRDGELVVMHSMRGKESEREVLEAREELEDVEKRLADADIRFSVRQLVRDLPPGEDLVGLAREEGADLIVIGVRRRSPVGKLVLGSNAQTILLQADCPVLAVKAGGD